MAHIEDIDIYSINRKDKTISVRFVMKNIGSHTLTVPVPEKFWDVITAIAQNAVDMHELQAQAILLGEQHNGDK